jgi:hypothetical protein
MSDASSFCESPLSILKALIFAASVLIGTFYDFKFTTALRRMAAQRPKRLAHCAHHRSTWVARPNADMASLCQVGEPSPLQLQM